MKTKQRSTYKEPIATCKCGAKCNEKKDLNRFNKRHPLLCTSRKKAFTTLVKEIFADFTDEMLTAKDDEKFLQLMGARFK